MTEIKEAHASLSPAATEFILHWGNLGGQWGGNRSVAQIHALLFISDRPLHAEEIAEVLGLARSNVSNSIKELLGWRSEEHTSELQSLMRISYAVFCLKKKSIRQIDNNHLSNLTPYTYLHT